jgi:hypothetical protein
MILTPATSGGRPRAIVAGRIAAIGLRLPAGDRLDGRGGA